MLRSSLPRLCHPVGPALAGLLAPLALSACSTGPPAAPARAPVVYGEDDRRDVYEVADEALARLARESIVALIPKERVILSDPDDVRFDADDLQTEEALCDGQRFGDQPTAASCSGTLIDTDLVLTAGHCASSHSECTEYYYVFDYYYEAEGRLAPVDRGDVYECARRIVQFDDEETDYAIIQLDRPVTAPHRPAPVRASSAALSTGDPVTIIGFGSGIPMKVDTGGRVVRPRAGDPLTFFEASLDSFASNSGSGVFDGAGELVGILVRGEEDYVDRGPCWEVNVLPEPSGDDEAEDVTYASQARDALCASGWVSDLCGDTGGVCRSCADDSPCPGGAACTSFEDDGSIRYCATGCSGDGECDEGHVCAGGTCAPALVERCRRRLRGGLGSPPGRRSARAFCRTTQGICRRR